MQPIQALRIGGALAAVVPAGSYVRNETSPTDAICNLTFGASTYTISDDFGTSGTWKTGGGGPGNYWVRWSNTSGTLSTGVAGTWQSMAGGPVFGVTFTAVSGSKSCTGTVEIATDAAGTNVIASGSVQLTATVTP